MLNMITYRTHPVTRPILLAFVLGWVTFSFSIFNVGPYSITILLLASLVFLARCDGLALSTFIIITLITSSLLLATSVSLLSSSNLKTTLTHTIQNVLGIIVLWGSARIDYRTHLAWFRNCFLFFASIVLLFGIYQLLARAYDLPLAFLPVTNLQIGADEGKQRGYSNPYMGSGPFTRGSSFFPEPSDFGYFMLWAFSLGHALRKGRARNIMVSLGVTGILASQSFGALIGLIFLVLLLPIFGRSPGFVLKVAVLFGTIWWIVNAVTPQVTNTFLTRAENISYGGLGYLEATGRFADFWDNLRVVGERPLLGHGIASYKQVAGMNILSSAYMLLLMERGMVGTCLFLAPFLLALFEIGVLRTRRNEIEETALCLLLSSLFGMSVFATVSFPPLYFSLGLASWCMAQPVGGRRSGGAAPEEI